MCRCSLEAFGHAAIAKDLPSLGKAIANNSHCPEEVEPEVEIFITDLLVQNGDWGRLEGSLDNFPVIAIGTWRLDIWLLTGQKAFQPDRQGATLPTADGVLHFITGTHRKKKIKNKKLSKWRGIK